MKRRAEQDGQDDLIDVSEIVATIWHGRIAVAAMTVVFAAASIAIALNLPDQYRATVTAVPAESAGNPSLGRLASQFGGLASIAGINIDRDAGVSNSVLAIELLESWDFLDGFIKDNGIETAVFAADGWNRSSGELEIDEDIYDVQSEAWVRDFDPDKGETAEPSSWELFDAFRDRISVSEDSTTGIISISVEYFSPTLARDWAEMLVAAVNERIRLRDREEARKSLEYLRRQVGQTSLAEMKGVFYQLIEEQTKNLMLTEVSDEYVLSVLTQARVPEVSSRPNRALICILGTSAGFVLAVFSIFFCAALGVSLPGSVAHTKGD